MSQQENAEQLRLFPTGEISTKSNGRMSGKYPVTAASCEVCERIQPDIINPVSERLASQQGLRADNCPVHNWYRFVLSYSPLFVAYEIKKKQITLGQVVLDPFVGTGTTLVECKLHGIRSIGIDAIDFLAFASNVKTDWEIDVDELTATFESLKHSVEKKLSKTTAIEKPPLLKNYVSPKPLAKLLAIKEAIYDLPDGKHKDFFKLAFASIIIPSSNVRNAPNFGLIKPVEDVDVIGLFKQKVSGMVKDLRFVQARNCSASSRAMKADARTMSSVLTETVDHIITSPPYPQEHDYTRTTRVELVLLDYIENMDDLRTMKKGMLRASTRNVYSVDNDYQHVMKFKSVTELMDRIDRRVKETNGTSGFEKLYAKLVGEYFGGMYRTLQEMFKVLKEGGTAAILVGDSHAFKMTHIETAKLLGEFALDVGFKKYELEVWLRIRSTAHNYAVPEYTLELYK